MEGSTFGVDAGRTNKMILYRWQGGTKNFGDELNTVLWPRLLPDFFDDDPAQRFLGIGSILDSRHAGPAIKLVAGAGFGGYEAPARIDRTWSIGWVRGPWTARTLAVEQRLGLGDPASLLPLINLARDGAGRAVGFMPHFESAQRGHWIEATQAAGVVLIDPRGDPLRVVEAILNCRVLLSEALHGVIVADAFRVPWVALEPLVAIHRFKWLDWAQSMELSLVFRSLRASSALEWVNASGMSRRHSGRALIDRHAALLRAVGRHGLIERAASQLRMIARAEPQLSHPLVLTRAQQQMMDGLNALCRRHAGSYLRAPVVSAYHAA